MTVVRVNDVYEYVGKSNPCFTKGNVYAVVYTKGNEIRFRDDQGSLHGWGLDTFGSHFTLHCAADAEDAVNHPAHYTAHPSGVECIQITEHMGFCLGNAVKYIWRADLKGNAVEDLKKAAFYIQREIERREKKAD